MYGLKEYLKGLEGFAPLSLSLKMIQKGHYDNSGIIVANHNEIKKVLFSLDLSLECVTRALELDCDTIITHHPAIYAPIKQIGFEGENKALLVAIKKGLNVISMHLNLDVAKFGIDYQLAICMGGNLIGNVDDVDGDCGYGKLVEVDCQDIEQFTERLKKKLSSEKLIAYGNSTVNKIVTFCGAGGSDAVLATKDKKFEFDTVLTSDLAHHYLLELLENQKNVILIPHYVAESYGFEKFYEYVRDNLSGARAYYFLDKRFM